MGGAGRIRASKGSIGAGGRGGGKGERGNGRDYFQFAIRYTSSYFLFPLLSLYIHKYCVSFLLSHCRYVLKSQRALLVGGATINEDDMGPPLVLGLVSAGGITRV